MHKITLEVDGRTYLLSSVVAQAYNRGSGYDPSPNDKLIQIQIRTSKMDQFLWDWFASPTVTKKSGKIRIINADENKVLQTISFEDAFSGNYNMNFYLNNEYSNETNVGLSAAKISIEVSQVTTQPVVPGRENN